MVLDMYILSLIKTLNIHIQNHLVEGIVVKKWNLKFLYSTRKHSLFLFLMFAGNLHFHAFDTFQLIHCRIFNMDAAEIDE